MYPINIGTTEISYIRSPKIIRWGSTPDIYGRKVYNPLTSSDPEWQRQDVLEIIVRAMRMMGVNLQATQVSQYADMIKNNGQ